MKKGQVQPLIAIMVALIIGIAVVLPTVIDLVTQSTSSASVTNEAITCTNGTLQTFDYDDLVSGTFALLNETGGSAITSGNYTLSIASGRVLFTVLNNTIYGSSCVGSYDYYPDSYQTSATSRTLTGILPLLLVVAFVLFMVAYIKFD